ncbi:MAG: efflux RND transporter periplasmic adaptor subunit, partial [Hydrogenophaga sp.]
MATKSPMNASPEKKQLIIIAIILVLGAVGGALILRGGESHGESDGHGHEEESSQVEGGASKAGAKETGSGTSAEQSKSPSGASEEAHKEDEEKVALTDEQVKAAGIVIKESGAAVIRTTLQLPGEIRFNEDRTAHIVPRAAGVVESVSANLGQKVSRGQVLAVISSSAVSEVRSELQAATKRRELAQTTYERENTLWQQKISPEQDVLQARQALREAEIAVANATQKLRTLGASAGSGALGRVELRAPFDAMVVEKHIAIGEAVREDANVFTLSDLSTVWAEMSVGASDLAKVRVGERVRVKADAADVVADGKIAFVGSLIGAQTRTAPARVELSNPQGAWRPGLFVTVEVLTNDNDKASAITVDANALQTVEDKTSVFTKVEGGFVAKAV